jgi:hypothetical protein
LSRASDSTSAITASSSDPAQAKPWRPSRTTRTPRPAAAAWVSDSISPPWTFTEVELPSAT